MLEEEKYWTGHHSFEAFIRHICVRLHQRKTINFAQADLFRDLFFPVFFLKVMFVLDAEFPWEHLN